MTTATPSRPLRIPAPVAACLKAAQEAIARNDWAGAIERLAATAVLDIQQHSQTFLAGAREAVLLGDAYAACAQGASIERRERSPIVPHERSLKLVYVMPSIVEGQAASRRMVQMLRLHDRARFEPSVIVTEEFTQRRPTSTFLKWPSTPSAVAGSSLIEQIRACGVEPVIMPSQGGYLDGARDAIDRLRAMELDIAVFVSSPACPISALAAWARVAPVQVNQNVAVPLVIDGIDGIVYHNAACASEDDGVLSARGIRSMPVAGNGTDIKAAERAVAIDRATLGVPREAVLLASAGNRLPQRTMAGSFASDLAAFLRRNPAAWWLAIGPGDFSAVLKVLGPLRDRVILAGPQTDIRPWLKMADMYVNEYPEGGANTVLESMACGTPVVALHAGHRHTECIGAELTGDAATSIEGYWQRVTRWCEQPAERKKNALAQGQRVRERFGYEAICRQYETAYLSLV